MPPKKKAANGYKFAEPLPKGTILEDIGKKRWRIGPSIGKGGFGEIYSAQEETAKGNSYPYVVKIEPHTNGPLFVEINFYIRYAKLASIESYKLEKKLKSLGMPVYYGSGSHSYKEEKYRFLVMDKYDTDLYKLYINNNKLLPIDTVFKIGIQILDVLEYIHSCGYVHADIKAANILLKATKSTQYHQIYLVDFGLVTKYTTDSEFKPNPKKAHDGTIEFLSRDAHQGVKTRRGDLEILAYNLIQWLGCELPWENNLSDPTIVQKSKEDHMSTVPKMLQACFGTRPYPKAIEDFLSYLKTLKFDTEPDYARIKKIFLSGVKEGGGSIGTVLEFGKGKLPTKRTRTPVANKPSKKIKETENGGSSKQTPKAKRKGRSKKIVEPQENEELNGVDDFEDATPRVKTTPRRKTLDLSSASDTSDVEMTDSEISNDNITIRNKPDRKGIGTSLKSNIRRNNAKKEVKQLQKEPETAANLNDSMAGYTAEMRAIAMKKKEKMKNAKKPIATTSKMSSKRGLVNSTSTRLRTKPPRSHGDVVKNSDDSASE